MRYVTLRLFIGLAFGQAWIAPACAAPPNIVVILTDDQGRGDYSAFGTPDIRTPAIDRLFREGMDLRDFRANCPVCSPTRAALLTGRYPDRAGVPGVIRTHPENSWGFLSPGAVLLPTALKAAGYHTAIIGKWHLGLESPNTPNERGFDSFRGFLGDMMDDYMTHRRHGINYMRRDGEEIDPEGHATDLFSDWAVEYLEERAKTDRPFFLYLAYNAPHDPIQPPPDWLRKVKERQPDMDEARARLVALIEHLDAGIGRVLGALDRLGLAGETLVVFTSDNGGVLRNGAVNGPYRGEKQHMYEGGLRVPGAARWPGRIAAGSRSERLVATMDLFPTLCEAAGAAVPPDIDGDQLPFHAPRPVAAGSGARVLLRAPRGRLRLRRQDDRGPDSRGLEADPGQPVPASRVVQPPRRPARDDRPDQEASQNRGEAVRRAEQAHPARRPGPLAGRVIAGAPRGESLTPRGAAAVFGFARGSRADPRAKFGREGGTMPPHFPFRDWREGDKSPHP